MIAPGSTLTLDVEKATAGGRMLARHRGQVVLVWGAIPGEQVDARVERTGKGVVYAETITVRTPSSDRRQGSSDWRCGGNVLAHVEYARQRRLKGEIVQDAFGRIGRIPLAGPPEVIGSPEEGYRMRARLHAHRGRLGFYREGSHVLCDAPATRQLAASTSTWIASAQEILQRQGGPDLIAVEIAENIAGDERACHLELREDGDPVRYAALADGLVGLSAHRGENGRSHTLAGDPIVHDVLEVREGEPLTALRLRRHVRAFFQGNRFLIARLVRAVVASVTEGPVVDLYAGGGLFGLSLAAVGTAPVTLVEGDPITARDLDVNAGPFRERVAVERQSVEGFLGSRESRGAATVLVDPPRTGLSPQALDALVRLRPPAIVYVSCDAPTMARDARKLIDARYELTRLEAFDLFPNTAHVEALAVFSCT